MANDGHNIPGGGDALARGVRSQSFPGLVRCPPDCECPTCRPELHFRGGEGTAEIPSVIDNSAMFAPKVPEIIYRGKPLNDRILIKRIDRENGSRIVIPDSARGKSDMGIVVSVSPLSKLGLLPNMLILFDKFAAVGQEIDLVDENGVSSEHLLVQECDVLLQLEAYKPAEAPQPTGQCVQ